MDYKREVLLTTDGKVLVKGEKGIVEITDPDFLKYIKEGMSLKEVELDGPASFTADRAYDEAAQRLGQISPSEETMEYISRLFPDSLHQKDPQPGKRPPFGPSTPLGPEGIFEPEEKAIGPCFPGPFDQVPGVPVEDIILTTGSPRKFDPVEDNGPKVDTVNHPKHYNSNPSGIECITIARHYDFAIGNALKYLWRHGLKHDEGKQDIDKAIEDLEKAIWYIKDEITTLEQKKKDSQVKVG